MKNTAILLTTLTLLAAGGDAAAGPIRSFVQRYPSMSDAAHYEALKSLSDSDHLFLSSFGLVAGDVYRKACRTNARLIVRIQGTAVDCWTMMAQYEQAVNSGFTNVEQLARNIEFERLKLLNHLRCSAGEIDRASCAAYGAAQRTYADLTVSNGQQIANPELCVVGVDPYCFE